MFTASRCFRADLLTGRVMTALLILDVKDFGSARGSWCLGERFQSQDHIERCALLALLKSSYRLSGILGVLPSEKLAYTVIITSIQTHLSDE